MRKINPVRAAKLMQEETTPKWVKKSIAELMQLSQEAADERLTMLCSVFNGTPD